VVVASQLIRLIDGAESAAGARAALDAYCARIRAALGADGG
jgi:hypothetical protein